VLTSRGEGWFNLADNDMPIFFELDGRVYLGFIDGGVFRRNYGFCANRDKKMLLQIDNLNYFTSGKGIIILVTLVIVGRRFIGFVIGKIKSSHKAAL
jgi:hypothetical protein